MAKSLPFFCLIQNNLLPLQAIWRSVANQYIFLLTALAIISRSPEM
jgi:hypothetical protein